MKSAMKPAISTALSVIGVAAAGVLAFTVNSSVLGGAANNDTTSGSTTVAMAPGTQESTTSIADGTASRQSAPAGASANQVTDTTTTYQVGAAGSVVIDTASGSIQIVSIMPAAGWAAEIPAASGDGTVKLHFYSALERLEVVARMTAGKVGLTVTSDPIVQPGAAPVRTRDDDDDKDGSEHDDDHRGYDDDEHDDEHEDGHHEDEDDD